MSLIGVLLASLVSGVSGWLGRVMFEKNYVDIYKKQRKGLDLTNELDREIYNLRCQLVEHNHHLRIYSSEKLTEIRLKLWELEFERSVQKEVAKFLK